MRKYVSAESSQHEMKLVQMGAEVEKINSKMMYVSFCIKDIEVSYVYNINKKNKYFLERIKPYPMITREFDKEEDVINVIAIDILQFKNASNSKNIHNFIKINQYMNKISQEFEDLYLYYNVPCEEVKVILKQLDDIHDEIMKTKARSKRVFFEKEPDRL